jgi:hypothetical protein
MNAICGVSSLLVTYYVEALDSQYAENSMLHFIRNLLYNVLTTSPVIAVVAYGDETYIPFQSWNVGNCTVGAGVSYYMIYVNHSPCDYTNYSFNRYTHVWIQLLAGHLRVLCRATVTMATINVALSCQTTPMLRIIRISRNITKKWLRSYRVVSGKIWVV